MDSIMNEQTVKKLALIIAANCTKESIIEECRKSGAISADQFDLFNKQMSDKLYTFLTYLLNKPAEEYSVMMEGLAKNYPESWALPELDQGFISVASQSHQPPSSLHH